MFQNTTNQYHHHQHQYQHHQQHQQQSNFTFPTRPTPVSQQFHWVAWQGKVPANAVYCGDAYLVIRAFHSNEWIPGKLNLADGRAYVAYNEKEVQVTSNIEVLTYTTGSEVMWIPASHGQVPENAVGPIGKDGTFVGRVVCPHPENKYTPGKIHPAHKCLYLPWDGKENRYESYEVCVIRPQVSFVQPVQPVQPMTSTPYQWMTWQGTSIPTNAVRVGDNYAVIRAFHAGTWVPGKLNLTDRRAYIPYNEKEVHVNGNIEVLTHAPGAQVMWISASHGQIPQGAIGPFGNDGTYIGRAVCPHPENKLTPGKVHPAHKCMYLPWDGKEMRYDQYEVCVIQFGQNMSYPQMQQVTTGQPAFSQTGFVQPSYPRFGGNFGFGNH